MVGFRKALLEQRKLQHDLMQCDAMLRNGLARYTLTCNLLQKRIGSSPKGNTKYNRICFGNYKLTTMLVNRNWFDELISYGLEITTI